MRSIKMTGSLVLFFLWMLPSLCIAGEWEKLDQWSKGGANAALTFENGTASLLGKGGKTYSEAVSPGWYQKITVPMQLSVKGEFSCRNIAAGYLLVTGFDAAGKVVLWKSVCPLPSNMDWTEKQFVVLIPSGIASLRFSVRISSGEGTVSFRNIRASLETLEKPLPGLELLRTVWLGTKNGKLPENWQVKFWPANESTYTVTPTRSGVELLYKAGGARFGIEPGLLLETFPAGTALRLSAKFRTSGDGKAALMVEFFGKNDRKLGEELSRSEASGTWSLVSLDFRVPSGTEKIRPYLLNVGKGSVTFLEASLCTISADLVTARFPVSVFASPLEGNRIIHQGRYLFNTIADSPVPLSFDFWGDRGETKDLAFVLEVPSGLKVAECFSSHPEAYRSETPEITAVRRDGMEYKRYSYRKTGAFSLMEPTRRWCRQLVTAFEPEDSKGPFPRDFEAYFYLTDGEKTSPLRKFTVRVLPSLEKRKNPKNFRIYAWSDHDMNFPDPALFQRSLSKYEEATLNSRGRSYRSEMRKLDAILEKRGWNMHCPMQDYTQKRIVGKMVDNLSDKRYTVEWNGKTGTHNICPEYYVDSPLFREKLEALFRDTFTRLGAKAGDWILMDYEPWAAMDSCYCPVCLKKFYATLPGGAKPAPDEIRRKYAREWAAFRCDQTARVNRLTVELAKKYNPGFTVIDYDYPVEFDKPGFETMFTSVCKDPRLYEDCISAHFSSYYHVLKKKAFDLIDVNVKSLRKPVFMTPSLSRNDVFQGSYTTDEETLNPKQFRQAILSGATAGTRGLCIFPGLQIDGSFFPQINLAMSEIAEFEELFLSGARDEKNWTVKCLPNREFKLEKGVMTLPDWKEFFGFRAHRDGKESVLSNFNFHPREPLYFSAVPDWKALPGKKVAVYDPIRKRRFVDGDKKCFTADEVGLLMFKVDPEDILFLRFVPAETGLPDGLEEVDSQKVRTEYESLFRTGSSAGFKPLRVNGMEAVLSDIDGDGRPEITVRTPAQTVSVALCGGSIQQWTVGKTPFAVPSQDIRLSHRGLLWDYFLAPMSKYTSFDANYELIGVRANRDSIAVSLKYRNITQKIELEKTVTVHGGEAVIDAEYSLRNTAGESRNVSFWTHNFPFSGVVPSNEFELLLDGKAIPPVPAEQLYTVGKNEPVAFPKTKVTGSVQASGMVAKCRTSGRTITLSMPSGEVGQFYFWIGKNTTAEMMTPLKMLNPGESFYTSVRIKAE